MPGYREISCLNSYRSIDIIKISDNHIVIYDNTCNKVLIFSRQGKFERVLSRLGKGPGEYVSVRDLTINEKDNRIILLSEFQRKLIFFTIDGEFLGDKSYNHSIHYIYDFGSSIALGTNFPAQVDSDDYNLHFIDLKGHETSRHFFRPLNDLYPQSVMASTTQYQYYDTLSIWDGSFDTIYGITKDQQVTPRWRLNNSSKYNGYEAHLTGQSLKLWDLGYYSYCCFSETDNYIFIRYFRNYRDFSLLFSKKDESIKDAIINVPIDDYDNGIFNDLDGGVPFWNKGTFDVNTAYSLVSVFSIKNYLFNNTHKDNCLYPEQTERLMNRLKAMTDIDNPILIIANLK